MLVPGTTERITDDPDLVLGAVSYYVIEGLLGRIWLLSHRLFLKDYDEAEILPSSTHPTCLMSADGGQPWVIRETDLTPSQRSWVAIATTWLGD